MNQTIRPLTIDDYDQIIDLWADSGLPFKPEGRDSREMMGVEMLLPQTIFLGLFEDSRMLALGLGNYDGRRGWVNRVAVDTGRRGEGLAGKIIVEIEENLREQGAVVLCALIEDVNYPSISCFQKNGYTCEDSIKYFTKRRSSKD